MSQPHNVDRDEWRTVLEAVEQLCAEEAKRHHSAGVHYLSFSRRVDKLRALLSAQDEPEQECTYPDCNCKDADEICGLDRQQEHREFTVNQLLHEFSRFTGLIAKYGGVEPREGYHALPQLLYRDVRQRFEAMQPFAPRPVEQQAEEQPLCEWPHCECYISEASKCPIENRLEPEQQTEEQIDLLALLDQGYETGLNSDIDSEEPFAIFQINIGRNGCESHIVSTGRTTREALEKLAKQLAPEPDAPQEVKTFSDWEAICAGWKERAIAAEEQRDTLVRLVRQVEKSSDRKVYANGERIGVGRRELGRLNAYAEEIGTPDGEGG